MLAQLKKKVSSEMSSATQGTYAAEMSNCWNNPPLTSNSDHDDSPDYDYCLVCSTYVPLIPCCPSETTADCLKRSRMLRNLCLHMKISSAEIPIECPRSISALCSECEQRMTTLWRLQGAIDIMELKIFKIVEKIQQKVIKDLVLSKPQKRKPRRFIHIGEKILDVYRTKVQVNQTIRCKQASSHLNTIEEIKKEIRKGSITSQSARSTTATSSSAGRSDETEEIIEYDQVSILVAGENDVSDSDLGLEDEKNEDNMSTSDDENRDGYMNEEHQEESMSEDDENERVEGCKNIPNGAGLSMVQIKQEIIESANDYQDDSDSDDVFTVEFRKRRKFCDGVQIYKFVGKQPGMEFLQCGLCTFNVPVPQNARGSRTAFMKMQAHIKIAHKDEPRKRAPTRGNKILKCNICAKSFRSRESLRQHKKKTHLCNICGRPCQGNSQNKLLAHIFTHKSAEEKRTAIANGEQTARNTPRKKAIRRKTSPGKANSAPGQVKQQHKCPICERSFAQQNHIALHMRTHQKLMGLRATPVTAANLSREMGK